MGAEPQCETSVGFGGQGIAVRTGAHALRKSLLEILDKRQDEISPRMNDLIIGLYEDWLWLTQCDPALDRQIQG